MGLGRDVGEPSWGNSPGRILSFEDCLYGKREGTLVDCGDISHLSENGEQGVTAVRGRDTTWGRRWGSRRYWDSDAEGGFPSTCASVESYWVLHRLRGPPAESELGIPSHSFFLTQEGQHAQQTILKCLFGRLLFIPLACEWAKGAGVWFLLP